MVLLHDIPQCSNPLMQMTRHNLNQTPMKLTTLTKITRWAICLSAVALAAGAWVYNPGHLFTAALVFAAGLNVEFKEKED